MNDTTAQTPVGEPYAELLANLLEGLSKFLPLLALAALSIAGLVAVNAFLKRRNALGKNDSDFSRQVVMLLLTGGALLLFLFVVPMGEGTRSNLLTVLGLVFTGVITLSSTTFVANIMAGLMIRAVDSFRPGDFVRVDDQFGRVTERGLFHTELQTEDRDLATIPNLFLIQRPVSVVHASGTIVSATVSLGYDNKPADIETLLLSAAREIGLDDPFVQVRELGDFSVTYRLAGFLKDVKLLLSVRSDLRRQMMRTLHAAGVEIVSPTFMNQRRISSEDIFIPTGAKEVPYSRRHPEKSPEKIVFDKAELAGKVEELKREHDASRTRIKELEKALGEATDADKPRVSQELDELRERLKSIEANLTEPNGAAEANG